MFIFKRKKIIVDCFTKENSVYEYYPIVKSLKVTPSWWNKLPNKYTDYNSMGIPIPSGTMKTCSGFTDLYKNSYTLPLWSDLSVSSSKEGHWGYQYCVDVGVSIHHHNPQQYGEEFNNLIHMKLESPWLLKEKSGIKFYFGDPFWSRIKQLNNWYIAPGIVEYKYNGATHVNMLLDKKEQQFIINAGDPLAIIVPLTENDCEFKNHLITNDEYNKMNSLLKPSSFINAYIKRKKLIQSKCPFNF